MGIIVEISDIQMTTITHTQNNAPIFIVGAARSGTTLLQYMLRSHPDISLPTSESHFFIPFYGRRDEFGDLSQVENLYSVIEQIYQAQTEFFDDDFHGIKFNVRDLALGCKEQGITSIPGIISFIFQKNATAEGKIRWGDKTPYYILHLETILDMFPNAQIIHIIRDGRDCSLSMLERKWDLRIFNTYHSAYIWDKYIVAGKKFGHKHPKSYIEIHYEDLLNQPESSIHKLCAFLKIEFNHSVINFELSDGSGKTPLLAKPLSKNNQQKWKNKMPKRQLKIFESLAGNALEQCGYKLSCNAPKIAKWEWFFNELHIRICHFYCKYLLKK